MDKSPARGGLTARVAATRICGAGADAGAGRVRVELAPGRELVVVGAGRARVEKFFVRVTEC